MALVSVFIHGLPNQDTDPISQFSSLREVCDLSGLTSWDTYRWAESQKEIVTAILSLSKPTRSFTLEYAKHFGEWIYPKLQELPDETKLVIIAYSAGGAIFYQWVSSLAENIHQLKRISLAVVIAAPHTFPQLVRLEDNPDRLIAVKEPPIPTEAIVSNLMSSKTHLKVILGEKDKTIPIPYGEFNHSYVDQTVIPDATHLSICSHHTVREKLQLWLRESEKD